MSLDHRIDKIKKSIEPYRQQIINHGLYSEIKGIEDLKIFMHFHIYAVWDFMSLLKTLQHNLTCINIPWFPKGSANTRFLINEIVVGEESDTDPFGQRKSHFEIYLDAMNQCGADSSQINKFISALMQNNNFELAFEKANTHEAARDFVNFTFDIIGSQKNHQVSAVFTFGREDLIPGMFISMINDLDKNFPDNISIFKYYLERHIEIDGDKHSHLALEMTARLCGENDSFWKEAEQVSILSLQKRIQMWDAALKMIIERRNTGS